MDNEKLVQSLAALQRCPFSCPSVQQGQQTAASAGTRRRSKIDGFYE
jgi:hypothetical protein